MRFAAGVVTDETIRAYVQRIRFGHDVVLGLVSQRGQVYGFAHGCIFEQRGRLHVEVAFSVDAAWRGAARNWPMRRLFEGAGLALRREDDEVHAHGWRAHPQADVNQTAEPAVWGSAGNATAPSVMPCRIQ